MQMNKTMNVELSAADLAEAVRVYLTTPRIRRQHKLPVAQPHNVTVHDLADADGAVTATITIPAK